MHSADSDVFLEGANVTFTCPPGQVLIGHNTSMCMGNGEWEPDLREVTCKGEGKNNIIVVWSVIRTILMREKQQ